MTWENSISMPLFYDFLFGKEMWFELGHEISEFGDFWLSSLYTQASNFNYSFESEKHTIEWRTAEQKYVRPPPYSSPSLSFRTLA